MAADQPISNLDFADIPNQIYRGIIKKKFEFTLMLIGETGIGKSTLINSLFKRNIYPNKNENEPKQSPIEELTVNLEEHKVTLDLRCIKTSGYSPDFVKYTDDIVQYIKSKFEQYYVHEFCVPRSSVVDGRVHCCLYLIQPGHLKPIDIEIMKAVHEMVNIIPVIAKADSLTPDNCKKFKLKVLKELEANKIKIYQFPEDEEDEEQAKLIKDLKSRAPFSIIGSDDTIEQNGEIKRVLKQPWGTIDIENQEHCDFVALSNLLIRFCMLDLIDTTHCIHYGNFKSGKLLSNFGQRSDGDEPNSITNGFIRTNPFAAIEAERLAAQEYLEKLEVDYDRRFEDYKRDKDKQIRERAAKYDLEEKEMERELNNLRLMLQAKEDEYERENAEFEALQKLVEGKKRETMGSIQDGKNRSKDKKIMKRLFN